MMKEIMLGIWLGIQGALDYKYKEIPLWFSLVGGAIGVLWCLMEARNIMDILYSCMPGLLALGFSRVTKEVLGYGDGIIFLVMGLYLPLKKLILIGMSAFFVAGLTALVLLIGFRKNGRERIAFIPFLSAAYIVTYFIELGEKLS